MLEQLIYLRRYLFSVAGGGGRRGAGQTQTHNPTGESRFISAVENA
jgi:hypothetical protein